MRILINGISNSATGGLVILKLVLNELNTLQVNNIDHNVTFISPGSFNDKNVSLDNITKLQIPWCQYKWVQYIAQIFLLPVICQRFDLILNLTDLPVATRKHQLYYVDWPYLFETKVSLSLPKKVKKTLIKILFPFVDTVIFQKQKSSADCILPINHQLTHVMNISENYVKFIKDKYYGVSNRELDEINNFTFLFYPAAPYSHKNHKLLYSALQYAVSNKIQINQKIFLTITEKEFMQSINMDERNIDLDIMKSFVFLGRLSSSKCLEYMNKSCALLFPSKLETLGLPLLEAIALNKPVLVYDSDYSRELLLDAYYYKSPAELCNLLTRPFETLKFPKLRREGGYVSWNKLIEASIDNLDN